MLFALSLVAVAQCAPMLVVFKPEASTTQVKAHLSTVNTTKTWEMGNFRGYAAELSDSAISFTKTMKEVDYVEKDIPLSLKRQAPGSCATQTNVPSWGVSRVSSIKTPPSNTYSYNQGEGSNVDIYVLDTGVRVTHHEFQGRASFGHNAAEGKVDTDTDGHGTHVAGTTSAQHYGVCKECKVISVKIFKDNGDCSASLLIAGFQWVLNNFKKDRGSVINISVGGAPGETSEAMDATVNALVAAGVHVVTAAGNENVDACTESPGRARDAVNVGSTMLLAQTSDYFLGGSNWGKCVKLFAPGDKIVSLGITSDSDVGEVDSGTSMAAPHVAGTIARFLSLNPTASLPEVQQMLLDNALKGVIGGVPKGTTNLLVHKACTAPETLVE